MLMGLSLLKIKIYLSIYLSNPLSSTSFNSALQLCSEFIASADGTTFWAFVESTKDLYSQTSTDKGTATVCVCACYQGTVYLY